MRRALAALPPMLALAGCSGVQTMLDPAGDQARDIDVVWRAMLVVCGVMYVLVLGFLAWALWRARSRGEPPRAPPLTGETSADPKLRRGLAGWTALIAAGTLPNDRGSLQAWIADPQGIKPGTRMPRVPLSSDELNAVVTYLETLK